MKDFFKKNIYWLMILPWFLLAAATVIQINKVLFYRCFFLNSWPFCSATITVSDHFTQSFLLLIIIFVLALVSHWLYKLFFINFINNHSWFLIIFISLVLVVLVLPFSSSDFEYYFSLGRAVTDGINPYLYNYLTWHPFFYFGDSSAIHASMQGTVYGPVTVSFLSFFYQISNGNLLLFVLFWKLLMVGLLVSMSLILKSLFKNKVSNFYWPFLLLQPLILWEWVANGHFDGLWLIFVLWAIILAKKGLWWGVMIVLIIATWIKLVSILFLPWFFLWWWQGLSKNNWLKQFSLILAGLTVGGLISILAWFPYWGGWAVFQPVILQSKWVANSLFGFIYYSLEPLAQLVLGSSAHFWLTRLVHGLVFLISLYLLWPYVKKVWLLLIKKLVWQPVDYYQAIFISLLVYITIWQKSFWPWYMIWLLPFGWLVLQESSSRYLAKIVQWLSWSPLLFYVVLMSAGGDLSSIWFYLFIVIVIMGYPIRQIYCWRKNQYVV